MWTYNYTDELYHYGVLGMKWGVRRAARRDPAVRAARRQEKKDLNTASNKLNKASHIWIGKNRRKSAREAYEQAQSKYNESRNKRKSIESETRKQKEDAYKKAYDRSQWTKEDHDRALVYGKKGADRIRKRMMVDGKSRKRAEIAELGRSTANALVTSAISAATIAAMMNSGKIKRGASALKTKAFDKFFNASILDASGKVLRRYNAF